MRRNKNWGVMAIQKGGLILFLALSPTYLAGEVRPSFKETVEWLKTYIPSLNDTVVYFDIKDDCSLELEEEGGGWSRRTTGNIKDFDSTYGDGFVNTAGERPGRVIKKWIVKGEEKNRIFEKVSRITLFMYYAQPVAARDRVEKALKHLQANFCPYTPKKTPF